MLDRFRLPAGLRSRWLALLAAGIAAAATLSGCYVEPYPYYGPGVAVVAPSPFVVVHPHRCWRCW